MCCLPAETDGVGYAYACVIEYVFSSACVIEYVFSSACVSIHPLHPLQYYYIHSLPLYN